MAPLSWPVRRAKLSYDAFPTSEVGNLSYTPILRGRYYGAAVHAQSGSVQKGRCDAAKCSDIVQIAFAAGQHLDLRVLHGDGTNTVAKKGAMALGTRGTRTRMGRQ